MKKEEKKINVFIVGSKSIGQYGGYETFVDKLTEYHQKEKSIQYHIACKLNGVGSMDETKLEGVSNVIKNPDGNVIEFDYHNAHVVKIQTLNKGSADAIFYDIDSLEYFIRYCEENKIENPIFYVLASRIGPFIGTIKRKIKNIGGYYCLNPDGHEWKRSKWSAPIKLYWKLSERLMVKYADLVICDSYKIKDYIDKEYQKYNPKTTYISYGCDLKQSKLKDDDPVFTEWLNKHNIKAENYYLMVGRFVPENNYETIIREFMNSNTGKDLVLITNEQKKFCNYLENKFSFSSDLRIKLVGAVYDQELLKKIRENAFANIHGHEVGGTNPSLLEALGSTKLNLLNDVNFNREVAEDAALYWNKNEGNLCSLIDQVERMDAKERTAYEKKAKARIKNHYSWNLIADSYLEAFKGLS